MMCNVDNYMFHPCIYRAGDKLGFKWVDWTWQKKSWVVVLDVTHTIHFGINHMYGAPEKHWPRLGTLGTKRQWTIYRYSSRAKTLSVIARCMHHSKDPDKNGSQIIPCHVARFMLFSRLYILAILYRYITLFYCNSISLLPVILCRLIVGVIKCDHVSVWNYRRA